MLIFTAIYLAVHAALRTRRARGTNLAPPSPIDPAQASHHLLIAGVFIVGTMAFIVRLFWHVGETFSNLQFAYFASYVFLFAIGCAAARGEHLRQIDAAFARPWVLVSLLTLPTLVVYAIASGVLHGARFDSNGGLNLPSLAYAFWEPLVAWGVILAFLTVRPGRALLPDGLTRCAAPLAYAAYIVHPPILVAIALQLHTWDAPAGIKFGVVALAAITASFALAAMIARLPGARRIL